MNRRVVATGVAVVALHAALVAIVLSIRNEPVSRPVKSVAIVAELLSPAPVATPVAVQSAPTPPKPTPPVPHVKPKVQPRPTPTPVPLVTAAAPSPVPVPVATPEPAPSTPAAPASTNAPADTVGKPTLVQTVPKNVAHLDCTIIEPVYPELSKRRGETGTAVVRFVLGLNGSMEDIQLAKSSGIGRLDDAALAAIRQSSCRPYTENGTPMRAETTQTYHFKLND